MNPGLMTVEDQQTGGRRLRVKNPGRKILYLERLQDPCQNGERQGEDDLFSPKKAKAFLFYDDKFIEGRKYGTDQLPGPAYFEGIQSAALGAPADVQGENDPESQPEGRSDRIHGEQEEADGG
jgi:hypothetical protein